jgi:phosphoribosylformylglycinamidine synthase PurS subunit
MSTVKVGVRVLPREVILDTQGRAVESMLKNNSHPVSSCRVGKYIELEYSGTESEALAQAKKACEFVLYNPLIENYTLEVIKK